jgi:hypothetical protein
LSWDIAEKELFRSLTEIDALPALPLALAELGADALDDAPAGAELLLELLELPQPAATSAAVNAAAAVRPARADMEYNGVPRSFTQTCQMRHVRDQIRAARSQLTRPSAEMLDPRGETLPLTLS